MILGLFTEVLAIGGVQRVSRHAAGVLTSLARDHGLTCKLLSLNDPPRDHELQVGDLSVMIQGFGRRKSQFVLSVLRAATRVSLAYIGHPNLAPLGLLVRLLHPTARYCVSTYGIDVWEPLSPLCQLGLRSAYSVASSSHFTKEKLVSAQKLDPRKVVLLPPALEPSLLGSNGPLAPPILPTPSGKVLLTVARLDESVPHKGVETVIQALPIVLSVCPDTHYLIVGGGGELARLERLAQDVGVANHVLLAGRKSDDELASYYNACDVFVMPSLKEGFGIAFVEAMAFGKPVIGGNHGGTPDVVKDGVTGFLVQHGDVEALANRLKQLLRDRELRRRMGTAGRRRVEEHYTFEHFRRSLIQLLS